MIRNDSGRPLPKNLVVQFGKLDSAGRDAIVGSVELQNGRIVCNIPDREMAQNIMRTQIPQDNADGSVRMVTAVSDPERWMQLLCQHYTSAYFRASQAKSPSSEPSNNRENVLWVPLEPTVHSFPGHKGRPGEVGGSAPQEDTGREAAKKIQGVHDDRQREGGSREDERSSTGDRSGVAREVTGSGHQAADKIGSASGQSASQAASRDIPAAIEDVNRRLDRYESLFHSTGNHKLAEWMGMLREHINEVGVEHALESLGKTTAGKGEKVQYGGYDLSGNHDAGFIEHYLNRAGVHLIHDNRSNPEQRLVSTVAESSDEGGVKSRGKAGDVFPSLQGLRDKLEEAKHLPGLEKSEDLGKLMGKKLGEPVEKFTPQVIQKLDETYGKDKWIVKSYGDEAYAGYGIFFPQRVQQIQRDAKSTIWASGENLAKYGFSHLRNQDGTIVGIKHKSGDEYLFGTDKYQRTIHGDARHWADKVANASVHEHGAAFPEGKFMAQPAFEAVGVSDADRAAGTTIAPGEGRVHIFTKDGKASIIPHSTWIKGEHLPVVFESEDTRAMAKAALDAINAMPHSERQGQLYAPDIIKTVGGYKVVEANPANEAGASGYLQDNPLIIDSYVSHVTGRDPAHVKFIRKLLSTRKGKGTSTSNWSPVVRTKLPMGKRGWQEI